VSIVPLSGFDGDRMSALRDVRSVDEIAQKILADHHQRVTLADVLAAFDHEATHAEWDNAARLGIAEQLREALRANAEQIIAGVQAG